MVFLFHEVSMIPMKRFHARVKLPIGMQEVFIEADNLTNARQMLEAQYGRGNVVWLVERLHD
jgi:hypothetical protein